MKKSHPPTTTQGTGSRNANEAENVAGPGGMLQQIMDTASVAIFLLDFEGHITHANRRMAEMFGFSMEELFGSEYVVLVHASDREDVRQTMLAVLASKLPSVDLERLYRRKDGSEFWGHLDGRRFHDPTGNVTGLIGVITDIDSRKRAEEALRTSESRYRAIVDTQVEFVVRYQPGGVLTFVNDTLCRYVDMRREDLLGRSYYPFMHPEDRDAFVRKIEALDRKNPSLVALARVILPDGRITWHQWDHHAIFDEQDRLVEYQCTGRDVTERKRTEEALRESEAKYRRLYNETPVLLHSIDRNGMLVEVNDHWLKTLGYERQEVIGRKVTDFYTETARKHAVEVIQPAFFRDGYAKDAAFQFVKKNGEIVDVLLSATGERDAAGNVIRSQAVIVDVTDTKRLEARTKKYAADLQRLLSVTRDMTETTEVARLYRVAVQTAKDLLQFDFSTVMLLSEDSEGLTIMDTIGFPPAMVGEYRLVEGEGLSTYVVRNKVPEAVPDFQNEERFVVPAVVLERGIRSALCVPMMLEDRVFGVLIGHTLQQRSFAAEEVLLYRSIGNQAAVAIKHALNVQALAKSEKMLQTIIEAEPECVKLLDENANLLMMNRAGLNMLQVDSLEQVKGRCVCPLVTSEYRQAFLDLTKRVFAGEAGTLLFEMVGMKGRHLWLETHAVPLRDERDRIVALLGVTRDVTARREADEALRASEARFRAIIENAVEGILVAEVASRRLRYANPEICRLLGYREQELLTLSATDIAVPEERADSAAGFQAHADGNSSASERTLRRKDGSSVRVSINSVRMEFDGRPCIVGFFTDVTEKRLLEDERLKTQKLESIGTLAGGIAHDFNNLLQGIFGYISMAKRNFDRRDKALAMLGQAERALHQSVHLTTQLLTFSKGGKPVKKTIDVRPVVENAVKFTLSGSRSDVRITAAEDLWRIEADEGQVGQVLQNIVLNADQSMQHGGLVTVAVGNVAEGDASLPPGLAAGNYVAIAVRDSGSGISAADIGKIFDPYFTTKESGSGLGLATSYSIVRNHGGMIDVRTKPGEGSTFTIYLPALIAEGGTVERPAPEVKPAAARRARVLVMDDEEFLCDLSRELLDSLGHEAETAKNGREAIEKYCEARAAGTPFDTVILDLTVRGGMGGIETLERLREIDPDVKAIVSSGYSDDAATADHAARGFKAYLQKPYDIDELREILNPLLT